MTPALLRASGKLPFFLNDEEASHPILQKEIPSRLPIETPPKTQLCSSVLRKGCYSTVSSTHQREPFHQRLGIQHGSDFAIFSDFRLFAHIPWNNVWMGPKPKEKIHLCYRHPISMTCMKFYTVFLVQQHFKCGTFRCVTMSVCAPDLGTFLAFR